MDQPAQTMEPAQKIPVRYGAEPNTILFRDDNGVEHTIKLPTGPMRTAAPNNMEYEDDNGVHHSIYLPQGTMHEAWDHLENKRWDELAKFTPYTNQGYTEDDFKKYREYQDKKRQDGGSSDADKQPEATE
ncbi:hypothetical protein F5Y12DRAFT_590124 [Xylaria sp. FL1777]|nr:hypothetical protein F5Y12DRAFT_590124 [Xylaria sp. FL1777]